MFCEKCNEKEATVHIVKMTPQGKEQLNLCPECAKQYQAGMGGLSGFPINDSELIKKILSNPAQFGLKLPRGASRGPVCPTCGTSLRQIQQQGFAGCPACYRVFSDVFSRIIAGVQRSTVHRGKIPARQRQRVQRQQEISQLRGRIEQLIREEQYEEAAVVRDRIRSLEDGGFHEGL